MADNSASVRAPDGTFEKENLRPNPPGQILARSLRARGHTAEWRFDPVEAELFRIFLSHLEELRHHKNRARSSFAFRNLADLVRAHDGVALFQVSRGGGNTPPVFHSKKSNHHRSHARHDLTKGLPAIEVLRLLPIDDFYSTLVNFRSTTSSARASSCSSSSFSIASTEKPCATRLRASFEGIPRAMR